MYSNYVLGLSNSQKEMMRITEESTTGIVILDGAGLSTRLQNYSRQVLEKVKVKWFGSIENRYGKFWKNLLMIVTQTPKMRQRILKALILLPYLLIQHAETQSMR